MRRRRRRSVKPGPTRLLLFFAAGLITGVGLFAIFYKFSSPRPIFIYKVEQRPGPALEKQPLPQPAKFKIAIVLDDFGYNYKNVDEIFDLNRPVTFSILPHQAYSKTIAISAHQKGYETILHLPLEPYERDKRPRPEVSTITTDMKEQKVLDTLAKDIADVPYCNGVSNHQGSKATEDPALMKVIFLDLKKRDLFFLDSLVTDKSVCRNLAGETGVKLLRRDVFLDNSEDFEYIKGQFLRLAKKARKSGFAVGIGHDRPKTIAALSRLIPQAEAEGAEFVFLSELIKG